MKNKYVSKRKHEYTTEDWEEVSILHYIHQKIVGIPLNDTMVIFYVSMFILIVLLSLILN